MKTQEFLSIIKKEIKGKDINKSINLIRSIEGKLKDLRNELIEGHLKCKYCDKYSLPKDWKTEWVNEEQKGVLVYSDCGYGDDDEYADVTYLIEYEICPKCKHKQVKNKHYVSECNRHDRWGNKRGK